MFDLKLTALYIFRVNALMSVPLDDNYRLGYDRYNDHMIILYQNQDKPDNQDELFSQLESKILAYVQRHKLMTLRRLDRIKDELNSIPGSN